MSDIKPTNPKAGVGSVKIPLHLVSPIAKAYLALAMHLGQVKYGQWNFRGAGVSASTYLSALDRHVDRYKEGEWFDPVDGTPHLANALACIAILIEGHEMGNITDDRPPSVMNISMIYSKLESIQKDITEKYADRSPKQWTIADTVYANSNVPPK